jgi:dipeptidyl aminopeptidase/acylaminoacyl peptidase
MRLLTISFLAGLTVLPALSAAAPHPFNARDLQSMQRISDPRPSPQGDRVAYVLRTSDLEANKALNDLWLVPTAGGEPVRLTSDPAPDTNPRWAPDGKSLYFLSSRSGSSQVWRLAVPASGAPKGDPVQVTSLPLDVSNLTVSPDGSHLAFSLEVFADCANLACTRERLDQREKSKVKTRFYDQGGFVRHWDAWNEGLRNHLFVAPLGTAGKDGKAGAPVDLTRGLPADVPSRPFGGTEEFAFSPDGRTLVFTMRLAGEGNREEPWSTNFDLYEVPADGSRPPQNLTQANPAWDTQPAFSPDGKTLAYLAMSRPGYEADRFRIVLRSLADGKERVLTETWDRSPQDLLFSADGRTLYSTALDVGQEPLFALDVATGQVRKVVAEGSVHSPAIAGAAGDRLVFGLDNLRSPVELHTVRPDGSGLAPITHVNRERLADVLQGEPEQFSFEGANGDRVYGWVVKPVGFQEGRKYPLAFLIHGGPQGSFHNEFHYRWNSQAYAGAGYASVLIDFHGSVGYGQAFTDAIRDDWGGKPLVDLQKGLDAALARYPWIDGDRACALGASYGGYMVNWIAGAWPDRFRCLVNHDGIFDNRLMYYANDELWFSEWEHGGPYWQNPQGHEKDNPVNLVERWKTPMLVVHGALDYRVPDNQGLATYNALQRRGIPSQFLLMEQEGHWVLKPADSVFWHEKVLAWLDRWLGNGTGGGR